MARLVRRRAEGRLANLVTVLADDPVPGHVRYRSRPAGPTHAAPTAANAQPPTRPAKWPSSTMAIIENFKELRAELACPWPGVSIAGTDSEVVAHLISEAVSKVGPTRPRPCGEVLAAPARGLCAGDCIPVAPLIC